MEELHDIQPGRVIYSIIDQMAKRYASYFELEDTQILRIYGELAWLYWLHHRMSYRGNYMRNLEPDMCFYLSFGIVKELQRYCLIPRSRQVKIWREYCMKHGFVFRLHPDNSLNEQIKTSSEIQKFICKQNDAYLFECKHYLNAYAQKCNASECLDYLRSLRVSLLFRLLMLLGNDVEFPQELLEHCSRGYLKNMQSNDSLFITAIEEILFIKALDAPLPLQLLCNYFSRDMKDLAFHFTRLLEFCHDTFLVQNTHNLQLRHSETTSQRAAA